MVYVHQNDIIFDDFFAILIPVLVPSCVRSGTCKKPNVLQITNNLMLRLEIALESSPLAVLILWEVIDYHILMY